MQFLKDIKFKQKKYLEEQREKINNYIKNKLFNIKEIQSVLLSGSVARGTFIPGKFGGAVDLTLLVNDVKKFDKEKHLGKMAENIPEYFISDNEIFYQFVFFDEKMLNDFETLSESKKFALLESIIIFDKKNLYQKILNEKINKIKSIEISTFMETAKYYITFLLNDYKIDRWKRRDAFIQLHCNLNKAIEIFIKYLFYKNNQYSPADDRYVYFSFDLKKTPDNYYETLLEIFKINNYTIEDYERRDSLFKEKFLSFID
jgi:predicted nucleotidyltransferase